MKLDNVLNKPKPSLAPKTSKKNSKTSASTESDVIENGIKTEKPKSRRMRMALSCVVCRKRKVKVCLFH